MLFSLVKDFLKWNEGLRSTVINSVGFETEIIFRLGGLRKKDLIRQILCSKFKILLFSLMKSDIQSSEGLFNWVESLLRTVVIPVGFETEIIFRLGGLRKKHLIRQILCSKIKILLSSFMKSDIQSGEGLSQMKWGPASTVINSVGSETELIFHLGGLRKTYLTRCQILSSKNTLVQFLEKRFSV